MRDSHGGYHEFKTVIYFKTHFWFHETFTVRVVRMILSIVLKIILYLVKTASTLILRPFSKSDRLW